VIAPARTAAFHVLRAVDDLREDLPSALAQSRTRLSDNRDRALTAEIATGTLRWQRRLDHIIAHAAGRPVARVDPAVLRVLRLSAYQILYLDRVPAAAVVDDAVDLTRAARRPYATGFVNGVLRGLLRRRTHLPVPPRPDSATDRAAALAYLGISCSHPEWLVTRWLDRFGLDAAETWVRFNNVPPALCLRANRLRATRHTVADYLRARSVETAPTPYAPDGLVVRAGEALAHSEGGLFVAQDEASQLISFAVGARAGERVLDLCAAPGGKTTAMAADMDDSGTLVACDVRPRRLKLLRRAVARAGATHIQVVWVEPTTALPFNQRFDRVLVDAPCSGLGTLRRDPDIRWRRNATDLVAMAEDQVALLGRAAETLRPGGRLVYATCSSEPEENQDVVDRFLDTHPSFSRLDLRGQLPSPLVPLVGADGALQTLPFAHGLEAFYAAALIRA
jgi:16S rRNA (cytosine967-C5)-methyltransferase